VRLVGDEGVEVVLLRNEDLGVALLSDALHSFSSLADKQADHLLGDFQRQHSTRMLETLERVKFLDGNVHHRSCCRLLRFNDLVDHLLRPSVLVVGTLDENITHPRFGHCLKSYLNFGSALQLQVANGVATLAYDKTDYIVGDRDDIRVGGRWTVGSEHGFVDLFIIHSNLLVHVLQGGP